MRDHPSRFDFKQLLYRLVGGPKLDYDGQPLRGATAATRYVGGTASGAPTIGTFAVGDYVIAQNAHIWVCTVAGTPGTWVDAGSYGSGGSGIPASTVDAKGDILVGTANDTVARKAVGNDGTTIMADSTQSDGLSWVDGIPVFTAWVATTSNHSLSGTANIDGATIGAGQVVLVKDQSNTVENGLYRSAAGAWSRLNTFTAPGTNGTAYGAICRVVAGSVFGGTAWKASLKSGDIIGTHPFNFYRLADTGDLVGLNPGTTAVLVSSTKNLTLSGTQTIDGVAVVAGNRVLAKDQTAQETNGVWVVAAGAWSRATDADTAAELAGLNVRVQSGTMFGGTIWRTPFKSTDTLGTTAMPWVLSKQDYDLTGMPMYVYGNSYAVIPGAICTAGLEWPTQVKNRTGAPSVTSYAISATRIADTVAGIINDAGPGSGTTAPTAGSKWPGTSSRVGIVFLETMFNDVGHYSTFGGVPVAISTTNTRYIDGIVAMYRAFFAVASSETRIEQTAGTTSGTWTNTALGANYVSGGSLAYSTTAGATISFSITPPQEGPYAGRVYFLTYTLDPSVGIMAPVNIKIDSRDIGNTILPPWEQYTYFSSQVVSTIPAVIPVDLPIDGSAHTVAFAHAGTTGQFFYADAILVPSENPNPILVGEAVWVKTGTWTAPQVAIFRNNLQLMYPVIRDVVDEFPNTVWVPSNMTAAGVYSTDGVHPNDRGMYQKTEDFMTALEEVKEWVIARKLDLMANGNFSVN